MKFFGFSELQRAALLTLIVSASAMAYAQAGTSQAGSATLRSVTLVGKDEGKAPEIEISLSGHVTPETQVVVGPDRIVLDFPNTEPAKLLRSFNAARGPLKGVRVGLYRSTPPVTRVVLDLASAQPYQVFPSGNTVIVKLTSSIAASTAATAAVTTAAAASEPPAPPPPPKVVVSVNGPLVSVDAHQATLAEVLYEIHRQTGADIAVPAGAEQEQVVVRLGPAPGKEVISGLLNGSRFNFIVIGGEHDRGGISQVMLSLRSGSSNPFVPVQAVQPVQQAQSIRDNPAMTPGAEPGGSAGAISTNEIPPDQNAPAEEETQNQ